MPLKLNGFPEQASEPWQIALHESPRLSPTPLRRGLEIAKNVCSPSDVGLVAAEKCGRRSAVLEII